MQQSSLIQRGIFRLLAAGLLSLLLLQLLTKCGGLQLKTNSLRHIIPTGNPLANVPVVHKRCGQISGQRWHELDDLRPVKVLGPLVVLKHLGEMQPVDSNNGNNEDKRRYNMNVGKALDTLQRQLPMVFYTSNIDFSIFAPFITVVDHKQHKICVKKSIYSAAVRSLRMASAISSIYPSMNLRKIDYVDSCRTIQCLVEIVLPDSVRIDGQAVWEGMLYFGLNSEGLIDTHIFDNKISTKEPQKPVKVAYPWLRPQGPEWKPELVPAFSSSGSGSSSVSSSESLSISCAIEFTEVMASIVAAERDQEKAAAAASTVDEE